MRHIARLAALAFLTVGSIAITGCESLSPSHASASGESVYAGGGGAFGEDPSHPGAYRGSLLPVPARTATADADSR